jgi:hypothetical protein
MRALGSVGPPPRLSPVTEEHDGLDLFSEDRASKSQLHTADITLHQALTAIIGGRKTMTALLQTATSMAPLPGSAEGVSV